MQAGRFVDAAGLISEPDYATAHAVVSCLNNTRREHF
jgi:hypothetical protein